MSSDYDMHEPVDESRGCGACGCYSLDDEGNCTRPTCAEELGLSSMLVNRVIEERGNPPPRQSFEIWMPGFHDMGEVRRSAELLGSTEAETFEAACVLIMTLIPTPGSGYWSPENPTEYWNLKLCPSREEAEKLTPEDLRGKDLDGRGRYG